MAQNTFWSFSPNAFTFLPLSVHVSLYFCVLRSPSFYVFSWFCVSLCVASLSHSTPFALTVHQYILVSSVLQLSSSFPSCSDLCVCLFLTSSNSHTSLLCIFFSPISLAHLCPLRLGIVDILFVPIGTAVLTFLHFILPSFFLSFCLQVFPSSLELCLSVKSNIGWKRKCNFWMFEHYWIPALYRLLLLRYKQMFRLNWKLFFSRLWNSFFVVWLLKSRTTSEPAKALLKISLAHSLPSEWVFLGEHKQFKLDSSTY